MLNNDDSKILSTAMYDIVDFRYNWNSTDTAFTIAKLLEEGGELSQAAQTYNGSLSKTIKHKDHTIEEAADTIITVLDIVAKTYKHEYTQDEILQKLSYWLATKRLVWMKKEGYLP